MADELTPHEEERFTNPLLEREATEAAPAEPSIEQPAGPAPTDWREFALPDSDELPNHFYRGKKLPDLFDGIKNAETAMHNANRQRSIAETQAAANETAARTWQQRALDLQRQLEEAKRVPAAPEPPDEQAVIEWTLDPAKRERALREQIKQELRTENEQLIQQKLNELRDNQRRASAAADLERQLFNKSIDSARTAMTDLKIPQEHWSEVFDLVAPHLTLPGGKFYNAGGPTEVGNWKSAITGNKALMVAIEQLVGKPAAPPTPTTPPGATTPTRSSNDTRKQVRMSDEFRRLTTATAARLGITDPNELQKFLEETHERKVNAARRRRTE